MSDAIRKTEGVNGSEPASDIPRVIVTANRSNPIPLYMKQNVLDQYRSYTYTWTLAALPKNQLSNPRSWIDKPLSLVILKSGGKDSSGLDTGTINNNVAQVTRTAPTSQGLPDETGAVGSIRRNLETGELYDSGDLYKNKQLDNAQSVAPDAATVRSIVDDFNKSGFGQYDMYIDDIEIETLATFTKETNTTLASGLKFDVIEPYSINNFIQALHVSALAAGYKSHLGASYVLRLEFKGYNDEDNLPEAERIPYSSRNFVIRFNGMDVELTDKGTRYRCSATPFHEGGFGQPNILKAPLKVSYSTTVKDALTEFMKELNRQMKEMSKASKTSSDENFFDEYDIKFADEEWNYEKNENDFSKASISQVLKDSRLYSFADPGDETSVDDKGQRRPTNNQNDPGSVTWEPNKGALQFHSNARIHECISAVIRDSEYVRNIARTIGENTKLIDEYGRVNYFIVDMASEVKGFDAVNNREVFKYTYIVAPYKVHYTKVPRYGNQKIDGKKFKNITLRTYNYFYTGENKEFINFKINFNNLYFESVPRMLGNSNYVLSSDSLGPSGEQKIIGKANNLNNTVNDPHSQRQFEDTRNDNFPQQGIAGEVDRSPYGIMARNLHNAIIDSPTAQVMGDLEIIGDPVYLTTSGHGNLRPERDTKNKIFTKTGEAAYLSGEMYVKLNFRNPIDIGKNGFMKFDKNLVPFSGIFRVNTVKHIFRDGYFRQTLQLVRLPGVIEDNKIQETAPEDLTELRPMPNDQLVQDQTSAQSRQQRLSKRTLSLIGQINRAAAATSQIGSSLVQTLTSPFTAGISAASKFLSEENAKITNLVQGNLSKIVDPLQEASKKLGLPLSDLKNASPLVLTSLLNVAKNMPKGVNLGEAEKQGWNLNFSAGNITNVPPVQPASTAPPVEQNEKDIENLLKAGGAIALASAFGVKSVSKISGSALPSAQTANLLRQFSKPALSNPLASSYKSAADLSISANKSLSQLNQISASKEVNLKVAGTSLVSSAATNQLGSKTLSPLLKIKDGTQT